MDRRRFAAMLLTTIGCPQFGFAQTVKSVRRVGVLRAAPDDAGFRANFDPFRQSLKEAGFEEGRNLAFEFFVQPGTPAETLALAQKMVRANVDAILGIATAGVSASAQATKTIPIVAVDLESDPIAQGFSERLARPGRNVTGLFLDFPELSGKWIELLKGAIPKLARVAVLWDPATGPYLLKGAQAASAAMGVQIVTVEASKSTELESAFRLLDKQRVQALLALSSPVFLSARVEIAALALKYRLPAIMPFPQFVDAGGLMAYGPHLTTLFRQAGVVMASVLNGARPQDIPIERPTRFEFALNRKTAGSLGLSLPAALLVRADRVID